MSVPPGNSSPLVLGDDSRFVDTGWRNVATLLNPGWVLLPGNGYALIRRIGPIVHIAIRVLMTAEATPGRESVRRALIDTLPGGFRTSVNFATVGSGSYNAARGAFLDTAASVSRLDVVGITDVTVTAGTTAFTALCSWPTNEPWPTSLPGSPA